MKTKYPLTIACIFLSSAAAFSQAETQNPHSAAGIFWRVSGNKNTVDGTHFIGTTDMVPLNFRIGNMQAGRIDSALKNIFWGYKAGFSNNTGRENVAIGHNALLQNTTGISNVAVGYQSLFGNTTGTGNTALGENASTGASNLTNAAAIGARSLVNTSNSMVLGSVRGVNSAATTTNVAIGNNAPNTRLDVQGDLALRERTIALITGQNNNVPTDTTTLLRITGPGGAFSISGLANGFDGKIVTLLNTTAHNLTISNQSTFSLAANRIQSGEGTIIVRENGTITFQYSGSLSRWMVTSHTNSTTEADGNTDYYSVTGTTQAMATNTPQLMDEMGLTFTPLDTIAFVSFHANGRAANGCGQFGLSFQLRVNGVGVQNFSASIEDIAGLTNKIWLTAIEYPVKVNANAINTVTIFWYTPIACANIVNGIDGDPFGSYRTLIVKAPHGQGTVNAINSPSLPQTDYWLTNGNLGTNALTNYIGTNDATDLAFRVNGQRSGLINQNYYNTSFGYQAALGNTSGTNNTAIGHKSQIGGTGGQYNTSLGALSLYTNTVGERNTAVGASALYANRADDNTGVGFYSLADNTTGYNNTAVGSNSMAVNTIGHSNTALGNLAITSNIAGEYNIAAGHRALTYNTDGGRNIAIGAFALREQAYSNSGTNYDTYNVGVGYSALINNDPTNTTAAGAGKVNTGVGGFALNVVTSGYQNTGLGYGANPSSGTAFNTTSLGYLATSTASNYVRVGNTAVTSIFGAVNFNTSDARFKTQVTESVPGLSFITGLRPVTYHFEKEKYSKHIGEIQEEVYVQNLREQDNSGKLSSGFIAQEVETLADSLGYDFDGLYTPQNDEDTYGLGYAQFVVPLVKAVQELKKLNDELIQQVELLKEQLK